MGIKAFKLIQYCEKTDGTCKYKISKSGKLQGKCKKRGDSKIPFGEEKYHQKYDLEPNTVTS